MIHIRAKRESNKNEHIWQHNFKNEIYFSQNVRSGTWFCFRSEEKKKCWSGILPLNRYFHGYFAILVAVFFLSASGFVDIRQQLYMSVCVAAWVELIFTELCFVDVMIQYLKIIVWDFGHFCWRSCPILPA